MPKKQRHTARRVLERLVEEHDAEVSRVHRAPLRAGGQEGVWRSTARCAFPRHHELGAEAEVDFGSVSVYLNDVLIEVELFVMRMSASGKAFRHVYGNEAQEVFLDGHVQAFEEFGGVPGRIRYDNLKTAVVKVLQGRGRLESERFVALRSHYGFESFFCRPGLEGAHEKGGVEGEIGRFRRRRLVPVPKVSSLAELNELLHAAVRADDARHIDGRFMTVAEHFALEVPTLRALPETLQRGPGPELPGRHQGPGLCAAELLLGSRPLRRAPPPGAPRGRESGGDRRRHIGGPSCEVHGQEERDPGARPLPRGAGAQARSPLNATALVAARASGAFTTVHQRFWDIARRRLGDSGGTKALIEVLLLHRPVPAAAVMAGMERALCAGSVDPAVVAIEARRAMDATPAPVVPIGALARFDRPPPTLDDYDGLLEAR